jgi:D-glycero-beta-D-manno-heptose-7-phosphate kinase
LKITRKELNKIFEKFNNLRVLIIGDVMIDAYMWGNVNRISPEAPVPIVAVTKKENRLGGAANVALNVQAMGATPILCSVIGVDPDGQVFLDLLKQQKLSPKGILKSRNRITTVKTRILSHNHQILRVDEEVENDITSAETSQLLILISHLVKSEKIDVIIFEDYDKGLITQPLIQEVVKLAKNRGIPTVVDPKKKNFNNYKGVTLFKPNLKELKEGLKTDFNPYNLKELERVIENFRDRQKIESVMVTLSERGIYVQGGKANSLIPAHVRSISDVSGAGDTVVSVAALCRALNLSSKMTATLANLAGGLVCEYAGVVPIDKEQLREEALGLTK